MNTQAMLTSCLAQSPLLFAFAWTTSAFSIVSNPPHRSTLLSSSKLASSASSSPSTTNATIDVHPASTTTTTWQPMPWTVNQAYGDFDQEDWAWAYSSVPDEAIGAYECKNIEGSLPPDLRGVFYRVGPGNFERGGKRYHHVLDGDGFIASFEFTDDATVQYRGRFVETEYFLKEQAQDAILYRNVFGTQRPGGVFTNAFDVNLKNVANTNLLKWGGRLFALWEGGRPYELDPNTLEILPPSAGGPFEDLGQPDATRGITIDEGGPMDQLINLGRSFSAHPHIVDDGATLVAIRFAQNPSSKDLKMEFVEYDPQWRVKSAVKYDVPGTPSAPHDFSVSDGYYCFFQNRFELNSVPFLLGLKAPTQVMQVPLDQPNILHLVPRRNDSKNVAVTEVVTVEIPSYFCIHNIPRVQESLDGKTLTIYSNGWDLTDPRFFPQSSKAKERMVPFLGAWGGRCPDFAGETVPPSMLYRTIVNLETKEVSHAEVVKGLVIEFPTQDEEIDSSLLYFSIASADYTSLPGTGHVQVDTQLDRVAIHWYEPKIFTGEITPVAKRNGQPGSWLLTLLFDANYKCASLAILDSECFEQGPVCRIHLPHALAYCLHGMFAKNR